MTTKKGVRIDVRVTRTWRVRLLPRVLGDLGILGDAKDCHLLSSHNPRLPSRPRRQEGKSLIVVTCVGGAHDRESILANIPVSQCDVQHSVLGELLAKYRRSISTNGGGVATRKFNE